MAKLPMIRSEDVDTTSVTFTPDTTKIAVSNSFFKKSGNTVSIYLYFQPTNNFSQNTEVNIGSLNCTIPNGAMYSGEVVRSDTLTVGGFTINRYGIVYVKLTNVDTTKNYNINATFIV